MIDNSFFYSSTSSFYSRLFCLFLYFELFEPLLCILSKLFPLFILLFSWIFRLTLIIFVFWYNCGIHLKYLSCLFKLHVDVHLLLFYFLQWFLMMSSFDIQLLSSRWFEMTTILLVLVSLTILAQSRLSWFVV
jgi:hypothetical protein